MSVKPPLPPGYILVTINAKMHYFEPESLKKIYGRGHSPLASPSPIGDGETPSPNPTSSAPPQICQPPSYFFTILTLRILLELHCRHAVYDFMIGDDISSNLNKL